MPGPDAIDPTIGPIPAEMFNRLAIINHSHQAGKTYGLYETAPITEATAPSVPHNLMPIMRVASLLYHRHVTGNFDLMTINDCIGHLSQGDVMLLEAIRKEIPSPWDK